MVSLAGELTFTEERHGKPETDFDSLNGSESEQESTGEESTGEESTGEEISLAETVQQAVDARHDVSGHPCFPSSLCACGPVSLHVMLLPLPCRGFLSWPRKRTFQRHSFP
jgi:hypothetical protein